MQLPVATFITTPSRGRLERFRGQGWSLSRAVDVLPTSLLQRHHWAMTQFPRSGCRTLVKVMRMPAPGCPTWHVPVSVSPCLLSRGGPRSCEHPLMAGTHGMSRELLIKHAFMMGLLLMTGAGHVARIAGRCRLHNESAVAGRIWPCVMSCWSMLPAGWICACWQDLAIHIAL